MEIESTTMKPRTPRTNLGTGLVSHKDLMPPFPEENAMVDQKNRQGRNGSRASGAEMALRHEQRWSYTPFPAPPCQPALGPGASEETHWPAWHVCVPSA